MTITTYPLPDLSFVQSKFLDYLRSHYICSSDLVDDLVTFSQFKVTFYPIYKLNYDIDAVFITSTKRVIHREKSENVSLCIDGGTWEEFYNPIYTHYRKTPTQTYSSEFNSSWPSATIPVVTYSDKSIAKIIIDRHSRTVNYIGKNGVRYSKFCVPSSRDLCVYNVVLMYIPIMKMNIDIKQSSYSISKIYYTQDKLLFSSVLNTCVVCKKHVDRGYICNECGSIVHKRTFLDSHGFICKQCGKTLCRVCTYVIGFRDYVCRDCAKRSGKPYRNVSPRMREKNIVGLSILASVLLMSFIIPTSLEAKIASIGIIIVLGLIFIFIFSSVNQENELDKINLKT
ncbi:MAG: hypothetical protein MJY64_01485 [archaeon]|nr:hypothetical protein [archaeon]